MLLNRLGHKFQGMTALSSKNKYLDGVVPSTVFDLDATISASYSGSGTLWHNLTSHPADGSDATDYDFLLGNGSTAPTFPAFSVAPGSTEAYWHMGGDDYFHLARGANTNFINNLHKTSGGENFWIAVAVRLISGSATAYVSTRTTMDFSSTGVGFEQLNNNFCRLSQSNSNGQSNFATASAVSIGPDYLFIWSHSAATSQSRLWLNSTSITREATHTFGISTDPASLLYIGSSSGGANAAPNNARIYSVAMGNGYLDADQGAKIVNHLRARHKRAYSMP